jgi:hypothetical protein
MVVQRWKSYHVKVETLENIMGVRLISLRTMFPKSDENISIRIPPEKWKWYNIDEALFSIGFTGNEVVYINV